MREVDLVGARRAASVPRDGAAPGPDPEGGRHDVGGDHGLLARRRCDGADRAPGRRGRHRVGARGRRRRRAFRAADLRAHEARGGAAPGRTLPRRAARAGAMRRPSLGRLGHGAAARAGAGPQPAHGPKPGGAGRRGRAGPRDVSDGVERRDGGVGVRRPGVADDRLVPVARPAPGRRSRRRRETGGARARAPVARVHEPGADAPPGPRGSSFFHGELHAPRRPPRGGPPRGHAGGARVLAPTPRRRLYHLPAAARLARPAREGGARRNPRAQARRGSQRRARRRRSRAPWGGLPRRGPHRRHREDRERPIVESRRRRDPGPVGACLRHLLHARVPREMHQAGRQK
mmetsp:Transcript_30138/g.102424  ORF Transcript_30138/g.102424 Transcript_30138/m.102424 type:complete len:346 (-) Transcript_30138:103-1140(-)